MARRATKEARYMSFMLMSKQRGMEGERLERKWRCEAREVPYIYAKYHFSCAVKQRKISYGILYVHGLR